MNQYNENMPYIFISYSHRDNDLVLPIIKRLRAEGYNLWYDDGVEAGSEWDENIARHIGTCSYFIAFVSKNYIDSKNCKDELNYSRDLNKEQFLIYLEDVELPCGMAMRMNRIQAIYWNKYMPNDMERAYQKIFTAIGIEKTRVFMPDMTTHSQGQPVTPHVQPQQVQPVTPQVQPQQAQPVMNHAQGFSNAVSKKKPGAFLKVALIICGILLVLFLIFALVLGVFLIKKMIASENTGVTIEEYIEVDSDHPLYEYYERAAYGELDAMIYLSSVYFEGNDVVDVDYDEALYWSEMAAENGDVDSMYRLVCLYYEDYVIEPDKYARCVYWCTLMLEADPENTDAMYYMGCCYYNGNYGVVEDPELAFYYWYEGARRGHLDCMYNVYCCYENGYGIEADYDKALEWYQILEDAGYEF